MLKMEDIVLDLQTQVKSLQRRLVEVERRPVAMTSEAEQNGAGRRVVINGTTYYIDAAGNAVLNKITGSSFGVIGDLTNNTSAAPIYLMNKWIGNSADPEQISIALCQTDITAAAFTGFNGTIDFYRGNAVAGGVVGSIEISIVNVYEQLYCTKFIAGQGPGTWSLVKGTVGGTEYIILQSSSLSMVDVFVNGAARGMEPTMVRYADISSISTWLNPHIAIDSANNVEVSSPKITSVKPGATQAAAGASARELWKTASHATLPDNVVMIGV